MALTTPDEPTPTPTPTRSATSSTSSLLEEGKGARADKAFRLTALTAGASVLAILGLIAVTMISGAWPAFSELGTSYFFGTEWVPSSGKYGILPLVWGTILVSLIARAFAVPISVGISDRIPVMKD